VRAVFGALSTTLHSVNHSHAGAFDERHLAIIERALPNHNTMALRTDRLKVTDGVVQAYGTRVQIACTNSVRDLFPSMML